MKKQISIALSVLLIMMISSIVSAAVPTITSLDDDGKDFYNIDVTHPSEVFPSRPFVIGTAIPSTSNTLGLMITPKCEMNVKSTGTEQTYSFQCVIKEKTQFQIIDVASNRMLARFTIGMFPKDFCEPRCGSDQECVNNECVIRETPVVDATTQNSSPLSDDPENNFSVEKFQEDITKKLELPNTTADIIEKRTDEGMILLEAGTENNYQKIDEITIEPKDDSIIENSKEQLTDLLYEEKVIRKSLDEHEQSAQGKATVSKTVTHEKQDEDVSTKVTITITPIENQTELDIVEVIPKSVAMNARELIYNIEPRILEEDPVIMWHLSDIEAPVNLSYRVEKNVSVVGNTILLSDDVKSDFDWRTLLPLLFIPLFGGIVLIFSKAKDKAMPRN